jgi:transcriptional regulator with XRE-family HTH domain
MSFGEHVQKRREELGLNQSDLAQRVGVGQSSVCDWEKGRRPAPRPKLAPLAKALRVPVKQVEAWWIADLLSEAA